MRTTAWNKRGYLQIPFSWIFAIIIGTFILFLAIFFVTKMMSSEQTQLDATTAKQISILMNPLETGFESEKTTTMILPSGTRIINRCNNIGVFGTQKIKVSQKIFNKWTETDTEISSHNKYIFSDKFVEGKKFYLSSMVFEYPFKVADLIFLTSKEYCFLDVPEEIKNKIPNQENIKTEKEKCSEESVKVCFDYGSDCDIEVNYPMKYVEKEGEKLYFTGNLIYGAIFADKEIYECQIKRLMQRVEQLASLYEEKSSFLSQKNCDSGLDLDLLQLENSAKNFESSKDFDFMDPLVETIENKNEFGGNCQLW